MVVLLLVKIETKIKRVGGVKSDPSNYINFKFFEFDKLTLRIMYYFHIIFLFYFEISQINKEETNKETKNEYLF